MDFPNLTAGGAIPEHERSTASTAALTGDRERNKLDQEPRYSAGSGYMLTQARRTEIQETPRGPRKRDRPLLCHGPGFVLCAGVGKVGSGLGAYAALGKRAGRRQNCGCDRRTTLHYCYMAGRTHYQGRHEFRPLRIDCSSPAHPLSRR
jgi:hypothetical protein